MKVFITHYTKLINRKNHIINELNKNSITNYEFIEYFDKELLTKEELSRFKDINEGTISLMLKHLYIYKEISEKYDYALIFEDDIILEDNFIKKLNMYMTQLPENFDMLFIGNGCNLHIEQNKIESHKYIYEKCLYPTSWGGDGATRCLDSYIVSKKCAIKICDYIDNLNSKINLPIDWLLNIIAREKNLYVYWAEPTIVTQGSQNGTFEGSH